MCPKMCGTRWRTCVNYYGLSGVSSVVSPSQRFPVLEVSLPPVVPRERGIVGFLAAHTKRVPEHTTLTFTQ